ncbi:MAG: ABC transporter ATP-binding protein, partial [Ruminococcus sp.]|nr:ABC transporter ATP-binding protein [Ruminococcus sp.]
MMPKSPKAPQKPSNAKNTMKRIFSYMYGFKAQFIIVVIGVVFSSFAGIAGNYLLKPLIDNIEEAVKSGSWDKTKFISILSVMAGIYILGALSSFVYARIMMKISTTTLMRIRNDLFTKMESLPIRFFDKHTHGELMSLYTNDTDTLREMLSNSIVQFISSAISIVGVFTAMLIYSWQ